MHELWTECLFLSVCVQSITDRIRYIHGFFFVSKFSNTNQCVIEIESTVTFGENWSFLFVLELARLEPHYAQLAVPWSRPSATHFLRSITEQTKMPTLYLRINPFIRISEIAWTRTGDPRISSETHCCDLHNHFLEVSTFTHMFVRAFGEREQKLKSNSNNISALSRTRALARAYDLISFHCATYTMLQSDVAIHISLVLVLHDVDKICKVSDGIWRKLEP